MSAKSTGRHSIAMILSVSIHVGIALMLMGLPQRLAKMWKTVDMDIVEKPRPVEEEPELEPEAEPEPEPEPEPEAPREVHKPREAPKPEPEPEIPEEPPPPPEAEEAPPVFDLGDNTFAENGTGAGWNLKRSEGNTKFAAVQKGNKSVRGTAPKRATEPVAPQRQAPSFKPVPSKDWSRKPEPVDSGNDMPEYPFEAKRDGVEGKVRLQVFIGNDGAVKRVRILSDPGKGLGEASRIHALKKKWRPALDKNGNPVDTVIVWTYTFILDS